MLNQKSKIKEIEYYIQQVEMLSMNSTDEAKIAKIIALQDLINNDSIKELIAEDLKDEGWLESTKILINTCNKRVLKSDVLLEHVRQCKNFMVFRYMEDKLIHFKGVLVTSNPWNFKEINEKDQQTDWINSKFTKSFINSDMPELISDMLKDGQVVIDSEWLYVNKAKFFSEDIFEDIDFLIKKKRKN